MSYTVWDRANDLLMDAIQDVEILEFLGATTSADEEKISARQQDVDLLRAEIAFYDAHPEIAGLGAYDPADVEKAAAAFQSHKEAQQTPRP